MVRRANRREKANAPLWDAFHRDEGFEQPFPIPVVLRGVLGNWRVITLLLQSFGDHENDGRNVTFVGHTLCL